MDLMMWWMVDVDDWLKVFWVGEDNYIEFNLQNVMGLSGVVVIYAVLLFIYSKVEGLTLVGVIFFK